MRVWMLAKERQATVTSEPALPLAQLLGGPWRKARDRGPRGGGAICPRGLGPPGRHPTPPGRPGRGVDGHGLGCR